MSSNTSGRGLEAHTAILVDAVPIAGARLRITKSRNNQEKGVRWAKEFEI
ncbi:MAG TPA: hypothetical protein VED37_08195 [Ktedonobacteraceae bacterium]|nr:hypothetical protein [Ktedonobacteraceae bacterium]